MKKISYDISEVVPYINWLYFYHAWGLSGKKEEVKQKMRQEAEEMLSSWEGKYHTHALLKVLDPIARVKTSSLRQGILMS